MTTESIISPTLTKKMEELAQLQRAACSNPISFAPGSWNLITSDKEFDPNFGSNLNTPGAKADANKLRPELVFRGFSRALSAVSEVATYGAIKYSEDGWEKVPDGFKRYENAQLRHALKRWGGEETDPDTKCSHLAHEAWNALAKLELYLRENPSE